MITKPIFMLGLSIVAGFGLTLDAVSTPPRVSLPTDPSSIISPVAQANLTAAHSRASGIVETAPPLDTSVPSFTPPQSPLVTPTVIPAKPSHKAATDYPYSALPFQAPTGSVSATGASNTWQLTQVNAATQTNPVAGSGPIIAIIDTGFALAHSSLSNHWWTNPAEMGPTTQEGPVPNCTSRGLTLDKSCNNLDNDGDGYPSDWQGYDFANNDNSPQAGTTAPTGAAVYHGTFVAGLIGASLTASSGGVDQTARLMPLEALDDTGSGDTYSVSDAIVYAADHHAAVINLSLGSSADDPYMHQAIDYAVAAGSVIVAAAGNDSSSNILYPANYPEVVAVGASDNTDTLASFSNYGPNLDLVAPGVGLCSTSWTSTNETSYFQCGGNGTSFASPIVAGILARLITAGGNPKLIAQFADVTADKTSGMSTSWRTDQYGTGRANLGLAITALSQAISFSTTGAIVRYTCSGTGSCQREIRDYLGNISETIAKNPVSATGSIYWQTTSDLTVPYVWSVYDSNSHTTLYYSVTS